MTWGDRIKPVSILGCGKNMGKQKLKKCGVHLENREYPILTVDQLCLQS